MIKKVFKIFTLALLLVLPMFVFAGCGNAQVEGNVYVMTEFKLDAAPSYDIASKINFEDYKIEFSDGKIKYTAIAVFELEGSEFDVMAAFEYEAEYKTNGSKVQIKINELGNFYFDLGFTIKGDIITEKGGTGSVAYTAKYTKI